MKIRRILNSEFNKNILRIFSGTFLAQVISLIITPILTRIYSPEDFSSYALFVSIVSVLSIIASLKYNNAVIIATDEEKALSVFSLSVVITLIFTAFLFLFYFILKEQIVILLKIESIEEWLVFVPISVSIIAIYNILNNWFIRKAEYTKLSINRVINASASGIFKIGFNKVFQLKSFGLILSEIISRLITGVILGSYFLYNNIINLKQLKWKDLKGALRDYKDFPIYTLPSDFVGVATRELPVFMLSANFSAGVVGYYMLTKRVLDIPFTLLSTSILEVFKQKAAEDFNSTGSCQNIFLATLKKLLILSVIPFSVLLIIAPLLFEFVFGVDWRMSGEYAQIMVMMYFFKFISSPLTYVFYVVNKLKIDMILNFVFSVVIFCSLYAGNYLYNDPKVTLIFYATSSAIMYCIYLGFAYKFAMKKYEKNH